MDKLSDFFSFFLNTLFPYISTNVYNWKGREERMGER